MAASITVSGKTVLGNKHVSFGTGNLGASYTNLGEAVTAADFGLAVLDGLVCTASWDPANELGTPIAYDAANSKLVALYELAVAAAAAATDATATDSLSLQIFYWFAWGR